MSPVYDVDDDDHCYYDNNEALYGDDDDHEYDDLYRMTGGFNDDDDDDDDYDNCRSPKLNSIHPSRIRNGNCVSETKVFRGIGWRMRFDWEGKDVRWCLDI